MEIPILLVASIAAGLQFAWALQLSLLTPYLQLLGISHTYTPYIWLCGPLSGLIVQPIVGHYSDRCTSRFGHRRPFIAAGAFAIAISAFLIGYAADIGHAFGDNLANEVRPLGISIFVIGFGTLDFASNVIQVPCRAFLSDLSAGNSRRTRTAYGWFSFFMAVGNLLGYAVGSYEGIHVIFPFAETRACDIYCANLKSCFLIAIILLLTLVTTALILVKENVISSPAVEDGVVASSGCLHILVKLFKTMWNVKGPMRILLLVTGINWLAWFPFLLFDTDWMAKEVFGGKAGEGIAYGKGMRMGAFGLMLNSMVVAATSLGVEFLGRKAGGVKRLWGIVNMLHAMCLMMTALVTILAKQSRRHGPYHDPPLPPTGVEVGALSIFSLLGIPFAITNSIPFALASTFSITSGIGQGVSLGVLNVAICIPQILVSMICGPLDNAFKGSNLPAFMVGAAAAIITSLLCIFLLPSPPPDLPEAPTTAGGGGSITRDWIKAQIYHALEFLQWIFKFFQVGGSITWDWIKAQIHHALEFLQWIFKFFQVGGSIMWDWIRAQFHHALEYLQCIFKFFQVRITNICR